MDEAEIRAEAAPQRQTIFDLARLADVKRSSLYNWIDGKVAFPLHGLEALAVIFRVRSHELLRRAEDRARITGD